MELVVARGVATSPDWAEVRRLYVQGIPCGPGMPDRADLLASLGLSGVLDKKGSQRHGNAVRQITRLGKFRVVFPGLEHVGRHYNIPAWPDSPLHSRAKEEDWAGLQAIYRAQLRQRQGTLRARGRLSAVEKIDHRAFNVARIGLKLVEDRLRMISETVEVMDDGQVISGAAAVDTREMESLARTAQAMHTLGRRALGFPVDKVGVVGVGDAMELAEHGLSPVGGVIDEEEEDAALGRELSVGLGNVESAEGVAALHPIESATGEMARDDATRLHGFLTVLGRAQEASASDPDRDLDDLPDDGDAAADSDTATGTATATATEAG